MNGDDLKKIFFGSTLFRLDTILGSRLVPILYASGLAALLLWAVIHLFATFGRNFGDGLWGLLEIAVFGALGLVALRLVCEVLLVFFKANETAAKTVALSRISASLADEVRDAISDIADEDTELDDELPTAATTPAGRRTARRSHAAAPPAPAVPPETE
jgi:hypothetical protein